MQDSLNVLRMTHLALITWIMRKVYCLVSVIIMILSIPTDCIRNKEAKPKATDLSLSFPPLASGPRGQVSVPEVSLSRGQRLELGAEILPSASLNKEPGIHWDPNL